MQYTKDQVKKVLKFCCDSGLIDGEEARWVLRAIDEKTAREQMTLVAEQKPREDWRLLKAAEVANRLNVSKRTVFRLADRGRLKRIFLTPGIHKSVRFREKEVDTLMRGDA